MEAAWHRWLRFAAPGRVAAVLLVVVLSLVGFVLTTRAVDADRSAAAARQAATDADQLRALLERDSTFAAGLANTLASEPAPSARRFEALLGTATTNVGFTGAMWVEGVTARGRPAYELRIDRAITQLPGAEPVPSAASYLPATFVTGLPFRRGADMSGLPALAATLRNPASVFAGTATAEQTVAGQPGFFLVQGAHFGRGPGSRGWLVLAVTSGWLNQSLNEDPHKTAISLNGRRVGGMLGVRPAASRSFEALTHQWRVSVAPEPDTSLQAIVPKLALGWPLATALIVYLIGRAMLRRRRAEREVDDIFDLSLDLLCIVGADGYLKRVNPAFERTLGYDAGQLLKRPLVEFVHPEDREAATQALAKMQKAEVSEPFERRYVRADGAVRWLQWTARPIPQRGLIYAAAHDVTDNRMLVDEQAALRRVATLVAEGTRASDLFAAVAAEVGQLFGADATRLVRYEPDGAASVVAEHGASDSELSLNDNGANVWRPVAEGGLAPGVGAAVAAPIVVSGRPWGVIVAAWKRSDLARSDTETRMGQFTELVATAVANAESRAELAASRQRIVVTADETRRRIERDLHDGAQQRLVQTILALKQAQQELGNGSEDVAELVERALASTESANDELRELARGIHPAVLTKGGLEPALKMLARRCPIPVSLDVRTDARLPELTEVTAYFVTSEALTNATKHANASSVLVTLEVLERGLRLSISDDGDGGADPARGSGLVGLKDRVEAAGGTLSVRSPPGEGTHLTVELPVGRR